MQTVYSQVEDLIVACFSLKLYIKKRMLNRIHWLNKEQLQHFFEQLRLLKKQELDYLKTLSEEDVKKLANVVDKSMNKELVREEKIQKEKDSQRINNVLEDL